MAATTSSAQSEYQRGKGNAKDVPPPPRTPPGCTQCVRGKGIPILPVRYAIAYNRQGKGPDGKALPPMPALSGKFAPPAGLESHGKQVNYTLRLLRGGYLYAWLTGAKQWLAWRVLKNTVLAKIEFNNDVDLNTYKDKDDGTFACSTGGPHHLQRSRFITVPESETSIQLGWSPTRLTKKQLEEIRQKKPSALQTIALPAGPHVGPADQLHQLVAEFATLPDAFYEHYRDFPAPLRHNEPLNPRMARRAGSKTDHIDPNAGVEAEGTQYYGAYAGGLVAGMMAEAAKGGKHPACVVAVNDPLGITQDLACLCQPSFYGDRPEVRRYWTDQMLSQIEAALISDGYHKQDKQAKQVWLTMTGYQPGEGPRFPVPGKAASPAAQVPGLNPIAKKLKELVYQEPPLSYLGEWRNNAGSSVRKGLKNPGPWNADLVTDAKLDNPALDNLPLLQAYDPRKVSDKDGFAYFTKPFQARRAAYQLKRGEARQQRSHPFAKPYEDFANGSELTATRTLHARWLGGSVLAEYFSAWFVRGDIEHGKLYDVELAKCLVGAADATMDDAKQPYLQVVFDWLAKPDMKDDHNLLLRAISWNMDGAVAAYFTAALNKAQPLIDLAPTQSAILANPILSAKQKKKELEDSAIKSGIDMYSKLNSAWGMLAKSLAPNGTPENFLELCDKYKLWPHALSVLTPYLSSKLGKASPQATALFTAALSLTSGEARFLIQGTPDQVVANFLRWVDAGKPGLLASMQTKGETLEQLQLRLQAELAPHLGSKPLLMVNMTQAEALLHSHTPPAPQPGSSIPPGRTIHKVITLGSLYYDIQILRYGIAALHNTPGYQKSSELWALFCSAVSLCGTLSGGLGSLLESYATARQALALGGRVIVEYGTLSASASTLSRWGKFLSGAAMLLSAVTDGYKGMEFLKEGDKLRAVVFGLSSVVGLGAAAITLIATLGSGQLAARAALGPPTWLTVIAAVLSVAAWYVAPGELEEWARDSIFGNRANRKHLRDDLHAFDQLSVIQNQRKEPAHA